MSITAWERKRAMSDQVRAVWDARRESPADWEATFEESRAAVVRRMQADIELLRGLEYAEFLRMQVIPTEAAA